MPPARRSASGRRPGRPGTRPAQKKPAASPGSPGQPTTDQSPTGQSPTGQSGQAVGQPADGRTGRPAAPRGRNAGRPGAAPKASPATPAAPPEPVGSPAVERALKIGGTAVAVALSLVTALWEVFLSPLYWGPVPIPLSPVLAALTTLGLIWFTRTVTRSTGLALLPGAAWFLVMVLATMPRGNGSLLLPSVAWMGLIAILVGSVCWMIAGYLLIVRRPPGS